MAKKKKNGNYVTEKTELAKAEKEKAKKRAENKKIIKKACIAAAVVVVLVAIIVGIVFFAKWWNEKNETIDLPYEATHHASITIEDYGTIHVELFGNEAPETVANFVKLANEGFYNGLTFHRIMEDFMAQGGDPNGNGTGDSGEDIFGEFSENGFDNPVPHVRGTISMARGDDYNSGSCQFFIVHRTSDENTSSLDGKYAAFGQVTDGMDIIDKMIKDAEPTDGDGKIPSSEQPVIKSISIHEAH